MPSPQNPYEAVLAAAAGMSDADCALDAELLGSALLGSVYAVCPPDRAAGVRQFVGGYLTATVRKRTTPAVASRHVFATLVPEAPGARALQATVPAEPKWLEQLGKVQVTGTLTYGDEAGEMTGWVATFAYDDEELGGPEHAVAVVVDRAAGRVQEASVIRAANVFLTDLRAQCLSAGLWTTTRAPQEFPEWMRAWWAATDQSPDAPTGDSFATDRALVAARLKLLG